MSKFKKVILSLITTCFLFGSGLFTFVKTYAVNHSLSYSVDSLFSAAGTDSVIVIDVSISFSEYSTGSLTINLYNNSNLTSSDWSNFLSNFTVENAYYGWNSASNPTKWTLTFDNVNEIHIKFYNPYGIVLLTDSILILSTYSSNYSASTDLASVNSTLGTINSNIDGLETLVSTGNTSLSQIASSLVSINSGVSDIASSLSNLSDYSCGSFVGLSQDVSSVPSVPSAGFITYPNIHCNFNISTSFLGECIYVAQVPLKYWNNNYSLSCYSRPSTFSTGTLNSLFNYYFSYSNTYIYIIFKTNLEYSWSNLDLCFSPELYSSAYYSYFYDYSASIYRIPYTSSLYSSYNSFLTQYYQLKSIADNTDSVESSLSSVLSKLDDILEAIDDIELQTQVDINYTVNNINNYDIDIEEIKVDFVTEFNTNIESIDLTSDDIKIPTNVTNFMTQFRTFGNNLVSGLRTRGLLIFITLPLVYKIYRSLTKKR